MNEYTQERITAHCPDGIFPHIHIGPVPEPEHPFVPGSSSHNSITINGVEGLGGTAEEHRANAERIAAAWNFCEGVPTEQLLSGEYRIVPIAPASS